MTYSGVGNGRESVKEGANVVAIMRVSVESDFSLSLSLFIYLSLSFCFTRILHVHTHSHTRARACARAHTHSNLHLYIISGSTVDFVLQNTDGELVNVTLTRRLRNKVFCSKH